MCPATGWSKALADFSSFYVRIGLSVRALPARKYIADNLDNYDGLYEAKLDAISRTNALSLFPRLARNG